MYKRTSGYKESLSPFDHFDSGPGWRPSSEGFFDHEPSFMRDRSTKTATNVNATTNVNSTVTNRQRKQRVVRGMAFDLFGIDRSDYALVSGAMFMVVALYFYFFLYVPGVHFVHYITTGIALALGINIALFFLFDRLRVKPQTITRENSNMITGGLIVLLVGFIIGTLMNVSITAGISAMIVGVFGLCAMYMFLQAMAMDELA